MKVGIDRNMLMIAPEEAWASAGRLVNRRLAEGGWPDGDFTIEVYVVAEKK